LFGGCDRLNAPSHDYVYLRGQQSVDKSGVLFRVPIGTLILDDEVLALRISESAHLVEECGAMWLVGLDVSGPEQANTPHPARRLRLGGERPRNTSPPGRSGR